jgi:hypothetical protein
VNHRTGLDDVPHRDSHSDLSVVQPVASRYTGYAIPALGVLSSAVVKADSAPSAIVTHVEVKGQTEQYVEN